MAKKSFEMAAAFAAAIGATAADSDVLAQPAAGQHIEHRQAGRQGKGKAKEAKGKEKKSLQLADFSDHTPKGEMYPVYDEKSGKVISSGFYTPSDIEISLLKQHQAAGVVKELRSTAFTIEEAAGKQDDRKFFATFPQYENKQVQIEINDLGNFLLQYEDGKGGYTTTEATPNTLSKTLERIDSVYSLYKANEEDRLKSAGDDLVKIDSGKKKGKGKGKTKPVNPFKF